MNRTRKIVLAGVGTAVILVVVASLLLMPSLHSQAPTATTPPTNGAPGSGGTAGNGTGTGTGSGTGGGTGSGNTSTPSCSGASSGSPPRDDGNTTNATTAAPCTTSGSEPDSNGDAQSAAHRASEAIQHAANEMSGALFALGQMAMMGLGWGASALVALTKAHMVAVLGVAAALFALVVHY